MKRDGRAKSKLSSRARIRADTERSAAQRDFLRSQQSGASTNLRDHVAERRPEADHRRRYLGVGGDLATCCVGRECKQPTPLYWFVVGDEVRAALRRGTRRGAENSVRDIGYVRDRNPMLAVPWMNRDAVTRKSEQREKVAIARAVHGRRPYDRPRNRRRSHTGLRREFGAAVRLDRRGRVVFVDGNVSRRCGPGRRLRG